jgi:hypothetical protein
MYLSGLLADSEVVILNDHVKICPRRFSLSLLCPTFRNLLCANLTLSYRTYPIAMDPTQHKLTGNDIIMVLQL